MEGLELDANLSLLGPKGGIWELGYRLCQDVFRITDNLQGTDKLLVAHMKECALAILHEISRCTGAKVSKNQVKRLKQLYILSQRLALLLVFTNDLYHLPSDKYHELNSKISVFSGKIRKIAKYHERKLKRSNA